MNIYVYLFKEKSKRTTLADEIKTIERNVVCIHSFKDKGKNIMFE